MNPLTLLYVASDEDFFKETYELHPGEAICDMRTRCVQFEGMHVINNATNEHIDAILEYSIEFENIGIEVKKEPSSDLEEAFRLIIAFIDEHSNLALSEHFDEFKHLLGPSVVERAFEMPNNRLHFKGFLLMSGIIEIGNVEILQDHSNSERTSIIILLKNECNVSKLIRMATKARMLPLPGCVPQIVPMHWGKESADK